MKNLFVGNLSFQTTETDLQELFKAFGQVTRAHVVNDRETGRSRGFAFVEMPNDDEAAKAMAGLNGKELAGRALRVNEAAPRPERGSAPRGDRPGGGGGFSRDKDKGGGGRGGGGGGRGGRFSTEDYRDSPRQPREPRW
jgi:cold-inducible RNA-binding protein